MPATIPPELMIPEDSALRIEQLQQELRREWLRYTIVQTVVLFVPFLALFIVYVSTEAIPQSVLVPTMIVLGWAQLGLVTYVLVRRIQPRQRAIEGLRRRTTGM